MGRIGRPTKLNKAVAAKILKELERGAPIEAAAPLAGISRRTFYDWVQRGARALAAEEAGKEVPDEEKPYAEFCTAVEQVRSEWETRQLEGIEAAAEAGPQHWTARAWLLERRFPDKYGRRDRMDHRHRHELVVGVGCVTGDDGEILGMQEYAIVDGQQHYRGIRTEDGRLFPPGSEEHDRLLEVPNGPEEIEGEVEDDVPSTRALPPGNANVYEASAKNERVFGPLVSDPAQRR